MKKEKIYKMKLSNICYPTSMEFELDAIKKLFGDFEIVKVRQCFGGTSMNIWFKTKRTNK